MCNRKYMYLPLLPQVVSALPDDIRPGPDLYGVPWEPVIISGLVGLMSVLLFTCRCYSSVSVYIHQQLKYSMLAWLTLSVDAQPNWNCSWCIFKPVDLLVDSCFICLFLQVKSRLYRSKFSNSAPNLCLVSASSAREEHLFKLLTCSLLTI